MMECLWFCIDIEIGSLLVSCHGHHHFLEARGERGSGFGLVWYGRHVSGRIHISKTFRLLIHLC